MEQCITNFNMAKIYKYCSAEAGLQILKTGQLIVSDPSTFNDLFDSDLIINKKDFNLGIDAYKDFLLESEILKAYKAALNSQNLKGKFLIKRFVNKTQKRRERGNASGFYFPFITTGYLNFLLFLAKPFTKKKDLLRGKSALFELENLNFTNSKEKVNDIKKDMTSNLRVTCFSVSNNNMKMWGLYSDKNQGICIEYDEPESIFQIKYLKKQKSVNFVKFMYIYLAYLCNPNNQEYNTNELLNALTILNKPIDWKYEKEKRIIVSSKSKNVSKKIINDKEEYVIKMRKPTKVILGAKCSMFAEQIESFCRENDIEIAYCKKKNYRLTIGPNKSA